MRSRLVLAGLTFLAVLPGLGQVAPAARIKGLPLGVGAGISDYSLDYGPGRRMIGVSAWADYRIFHGFSIEAEGTSIFADRPKELPNMKQDTIKGGVLYRFKPLLGIHPYGKGLFGLASIDFPSDNPLYTHDTFGLWAAGGGIEYPAWRTLAIRADYEYQAYHDYFGPHSLNPNGITLGATYYLRGPHGHR
jgi:opacity protein-like surface antigen